MEDHAALELDIERPLAEGTLGGFTHGGEGLDQKIVQGLAFGQPLAERDRFGAQLLVGERAEFGLERIDLGYRLVKALDDAVIGRPEQAPGKRSKHEILDILKT
jgi:hypothetical protein